MVAGVMTSRETGPPVRGTAVERGSMLYNVDSVLERERGGKLRVREVPRFRLPVKKSLRTLLGSERRVKDELEA